MKSLKGAEAFDQYFSKVYGDRWLGIREALLHQDAKVARQNRFYSAQPVLDFPGLENPVPELPSCFSINENFDLGNWDQALLPYYRMDPASVVAARALQINIGDRVLDMCAAPGGKSLILIESLFMQKGQLDLSGEMVCNEMSAKRRFRLMSVIKRYLPKEVRSRVKVKGWDGSLFGRSQPESFDKILLDAPCSGERGVFQKASDLDLWKEKRSKNFGIRQYALLASAFDALKPGGQVIYSTCSLSPYENDDVVQKLLKRKKGEVEVEVLSTPHGFEPTEKGFQALPDQAGWGPIFFCSLRKN